MPYLIGVDTGGTFTDAAVCDEKGNITAAKALSTPANYVEGVKNALIDFDMASTLNSNLLFSVYAIMH